MIDMGDDGDIAYRLTPGDSVFLILFRPIESATWSGQVDSDLKAARLGRKNGHNAAFPATLILSAGQVVSLYWRSFRSDRKC